jgi:FkbM family methyltransferase
MSLAMTDNINPADLKLAIADLRTLATTCNKAHHLSKTLCDQLNAVTLELGTLPLSRIWEIVSTLSQLRNNLTLYEPITSRTGSENREDEFIRELLPHDPVVYVDVGAGDPAYASNTWRFYKAGGHGLLIEPRGIKWFGLLMERPRDHVCPIAVGDYRGVASLNLCDGASSCDPTWSPEKYGQVIVQVHPFQDILDRYPDIRNKCNLCSIDAEGYERRILRSIDWTRFHPQVFVVEYPKFDSFDSSASGDLSQEWGHILTDQGYREYARTALNVVYYLPSVTQQIWCTPSPPC